VKLQFSRAADFTRPPKFPVGNTRHITIFL